MKKEKLSEEADEGQEGKLNMSTSPAREGSANAGSNNGLEEKPRLSEHEKKANHIASGLPLSCHVHFGLFSQGGANGLDQQNKNADKLFAKASID
jgi:hypothetical protein